MNGRQPEEMENEMGQNIFVGILCVLTLGACVWAWWISRGDSSENNNHSNESEDSKNEKN